MGNLIQELDNDSLLMMYAVDELPGEDRAELEAMLATDAGLRAQLESIEASLETSFDAFAAVDTAKPVSASSEALAVRTIGRAMRQWQVDRLQQQRMVITPAARRVPAWAYSVGAVAALVIVSLIFWGHPQPTDVGGPRLATYTDSAGKTSTTTDSVASSDDGKTTIDPGTARLQSSFASDESDARISDAESQANTLVARSDDAGVVSTIFLTDNPQ